MNLSQISTFCAETLGLADNLTIAQAKKFAGLRWQMIWDNAEWSQSRIEQTINADAGTEDLVLPEAFQTVKAIRLGADRELMPSVDLTELAANPSTFGKPGVTTAFSVRTTDAGLVKIRLHAPLRNAAQLLVIGKRRCTPLAADTDTPAIAGVDQCLIAFVQGDLYRWQRQFTKAQQCYMEAQTHLEQMREIETKQNGFIARIIPCDSYSAECDSDAWI